MRRLSRPDELNALRAELANQRCQYGTTITICGGTGCQATGCQAVQSALSAELQRAGLQEQAYVRTTACHGFCEQGPLMVIEPGKVFYCHLKPEDASEIVAETVAHGRVVERLLYTDPVSGAKVVCEDDIPFYRSQSRTIMGQNRQIDPRQIADYIAIGGYAALAKVLTSMQPEEVIAEVHAAGLRGRGGGGFPTARKWETTRRAPGEPKYVICNADEGDPGAYMNRSVLEGNPHSILEGMLIGAYAVGARHGVVYVRTEYPLAVEHTRIAIEQANAASLLGANILGTGFDFDVQVARGAGAFVAGESTALMAALEGEVSEPRPKDVHTAEKGYRDLPTVLNNVETWANVPLIINRGSAWFAAQGTARSAGTKVFALTGQVKNTGLVEVALGTPLKTIIEEIGGGAANGRTVKAVQIGGPSGGCIPAALFDLPVEFDSLTDVGAMMGSGGMVVMDEGACMVDVARYFIEFLQDEACGKCVPCRLGLDRMREIITDITEGRGAEAQLELLEDLGDTMAEASLCALGKTAPNPVKTTLRYFRDEYLAHIREHRCPAGVCRALIHYTIDPALCTGCGACRRACPGNAISGENRQAHLIDQATCTRCGICREECRFGAVSVS
ncbi:MAG: NADH-ubiquinone oxidoreductase-F iron-sulfur binding region domain-containing protein [Chloroflexota bacterium]